MRAQHIAEKTKKPTANTLRAITEEYFTRECDNLRSDKDRKDTLNRLVMPVLGDKDIRSITTTDVSDLPDAIEEQRGASMASHVLSYPRRVFNWYESRTDDFRSPIKRGMARTKESERRRRRVSSEVQLRAMWQAADASPSAFNRLVQFIILTVTRRNEAALCEFVETDDGRKIIPASRYKTGTNTVRPIT